MLVMHGKEKKILLRPQGRDLSFGKSSLHGRKKKTTMSYTLNRVFRRNRRRAEMIFRQKTSRTDSKKKGGMGRGFRKKRSPEGRKQIIKKKPSSRVVGGDGRSEKKGGAEALGDS